MIAKIYLLTYLELNANVDVVGQCDQPYCVSYLSKINLGIINQQK